MRHLTELELMDVLEGAAPAESADHVQGCAFCVARVQEAREGWTLARSACFPEPSPFYWSAFGRQLAGRIDEASRHIQRTWRWASVASATALVAALLMLRPAGMMRRGAEGRSQPIPAWSALPSADEDTGLRVLEAMEPTNEDMATAACRGVADCVVSLDEEESRVLAAALRSELATKGQS